MIRTKDTVKHAFSGLYFICENNKQERWMNMNPFYVKVNPSEVPEGYFKKQTTK